MAFEFPSDFPRLEFPTRRTLEMIFGGWQERIARPEPLQIGIWESAFGIAVSSAIPPPNKRELNEENFLVVSFRCIAFHVSHKVTISLVIFTLSELILFISNSNIPYI